MSNNNSRITHTYLLTFTALILSAHAGLFTPDQLLTIAEALVYAAIGILAITTVSGVKEYLNE